MKIHDPNSRFVFVPDLRKGDVVEPGFFHQEQVTISQRPDQAADQSLGPFPTEELARRWVAEQPERILTCRPAGTEDHWRDAS
jgi:hypothetical protein